MAYSDFSLRKVKQDFHLTIAERSGWVPVVEAVAPSPYFAQFFERNLRLAIALSTAQRFNEQNATPLSPIYGAVTSGKLWQFLKLEEQTVTIDLDEYTTPPVEKVGHPGGNGIWRQGTMIDPKSGRRPSAGNRG
jgi:hypothetical protein